MSEISDKVKRVYLNIGWLVLLALNIAWLVFNTIVIPPNSNAFSDWRKTCHMPCVKTHQLPRTNKTSRETTWTFNLHVIRLCSLKPWQIYEPASIKRTISSVFSSFELGGITKHLMTSPAGNSQFCFLSTSVASHQLLIVCWGYY